MDDADRDQAHVMALLDPFLSRIYPLFPAALDLYNSETTPKARAEHDERATASAVYCHLWTGFQREFSDEPGFHFLDVRGLKLLNILDRLLIRAKKVDENGRHRNAETAQQRAFDTQDPLPGLPLAAARLVIGYQPDPAFSVVERVTVRRPLGQWVSQILDATEAPYWTDTTPAQLNFGSRRRAAGG